MAGVTLKTVAKAVGVSPSTVSNAYNKPGQLSAALRERILTTAQELGYAGPDASARALRSGKAGAIGVLFTDKLAYAFSDPYAVGFLAGLAEVAEEFSTSLLLMPLSSTDITGGSNAVQQASIDGAAIFCVPGSHPALEILDQPRHPGGLHRPRRPPGPVLGRDRRGRSGRATGRAPGPARSPRHRRTGRQRTGGRRPSGGADAGRGRLHRL